MLKSSVRRAGVVALSVGFLLATLTACSLFPQPPVANFVVNPNVTEDFMVVDLDASTSSDPNDDAIVSYMWTFGDDVDILTPLTYSATVPFPVIRVRYPDEYTYTIQLVVVDETGLPSDPVSKTITLPVIVVNPTQ